MIRSSDYLHAVEISYLSSIRMIRIFQENTDPDLKQKDKMKNTQGKERNPEDN
jgi:hypothetical protein